MKRVKRAQVAQCSRYQVGAAAWRRTLDDIVSQGNSKKVIVFADLFMSVGDSLEGFYELLKASGGPEARPLLFFLGLDHREHFYAIARTRLTQQAIEDFNEEKLFVDGFCPVPETPPAWVGRVPDVGTFVAKLADELRVLTVDKTGHLCIPANEDIPVQMTPELSATLDSMRMQFPAKDNEPVHSEAGRSEAAASESAPPAPCHKSGLAELLMRHDVVKTVAGSAYNILVVTEKGCAGCFDPNDSKHALWLQNGSDKQRCEVEAGTILFGAGKACVMLEGNANFDPHAPCTIKWGFHRPGSKDAVNDKDINTDAASALVQMKGSTELSLVTVTEALKDAGEYPKGTVWGFSSTLDARKRLTLKPSASLHPHPPPLPVPPVLALSPRFALVSFPMLCSRFYFSVRYVVPTAVQVADANISCIGYFLGIRQAAEPDRKWELLKPVPVLFKGSKATLEPKTGTVVMHFVTTKQLKLAPGQCMQLH